ncbi:MAG: DUF3368 domain-containing protein [Thermomicrobiaceae bacterium]|nr:DUF3368 domain-containing protein [Thermomicrobiaceae bacterium]
MADTNFWLDLSVGEVLCHAFRLPFLWLVPDVIMHEMRNPDWLGIADRLAGSGVRVESFSGDEVALVVRLAAKHQKPSPHDLFALILAKRSGAMLVTGDARLRAAAEIEGVTVHGTLWVLDQLVELGIIPATEAAQALERMVRHRRRLPANEVRARILRWGGEP